MVLDETEIVFPTVQYPSTSPKSKPVRISEIWMNPPVEIQAQ